MSRRRYKLTLRHYRVLEEIRRGNVTSSLHGTHRPYGIGHATLDYLHAHKLWTWRDGVAHLTDLGQTELDNGLESALYLTPAARPAGSVLGHTRSRHQALDAGSILGDVDELAAAAHYRDQSRREQQAETRNRDRELLEVEDRLKRVKQEAHLAGINVSSEMRAIEQLKRYAGAPKVVARLRMVERKIDYRRAA